MWVLKCEAKAAGKNGKGVSSSCSYVVCIYVLVMVRIRRNVFDEYWQEQHMDTKAESKRKRIIQEQQRMFNRLKQNLNALRNIDPGVMLQGKNGRTTTELSTHPWERETARSSYRKRIAGPLELIAPSSVLIFLC